MESKDTAKNKSERFAVRIILLYRELCRRSNEYDIFKQILRSGTSIGANLAEAECAISRRDFLTKVYIALKECVETQYWLRLLQQTDYISLQEFRSLFRDCEELRRMLSSTTKTVSQSVNKKG